MFYDFDFDFDYSYAIYIYIYIYMYINIKQSFNVVIFAFLIVQYVSSIIKHVANSITKDSDYKFVCLIPHGRFSQQIIIL